MLTAELSERVSSWVPGGDLTPWLLVAGVVMLYLAYRAARFAGRLVSLGMAAALFLGAGPVGGTGAPLELPWRDGDAVTREPPGTAVGGTPVGVPAGAMRGVVTHVVDGDSLRLRVTDPGDGPAPRDAVLEARLLRIDAPELPRDGRPADCLADEAAAALARLVPPGSEVLAAYDLEHRDRHDRHLVHVWTADGHWVNGELVARGLARVVTIAPNTGYEADVRPREETARTTRRGIWDPEVCPTG